MTDEQIRTIKESIDGLRNEIKPIHDQCIKCEPRMNDIERQLWDEKGGSRINALESICTDLKVNYQNLGKTIWKSVGVTVAVLSLVIALLQYLRH